MRMIKRKVVEHLGHRLLLTPKPKGGFRYSIYKFVNGEQFGITGEVDKDTEAHRDSFIDSALKAFDRARAAPFN